MIEPDALSATERLSQPSKRVANRMHIGGSTMRWFPEAADEDREPAWSWLVTPPDTAVTK